MIKRKIRSLSTSAKIARTMDRFDSDRAFRRAENRERVRKFVFRPRDLRGSKSMRQPRRKYRMDSRLINVDTGKRSVIMRSRAPERPMRAASV